MVRYVRNPLTRRKIKVNGPKYKELCQAGYINQYGGVADDPVTIETAQEAATMQPEEMMKQDNIPTQSKPQAKGVLNLLGQAYSEWMNQPDAQKSAQITSVMNTLSGVYNSLKS